ncbi:CCR4-NOT transcription complex subunit 6-like [Macrobrachium rosenbergii]|uniref:CCR4-NOT transcription complex subunit 6-like n=1 Tax=Macrobrachium rosenbergii TaxID=79674 RepID=UPI0034D4922D
MSRTPKEGKEPKPHRVRSHTIMGQEEFGSGKKSYWPELEITGNIRNISPAVWSLQHLTSLYLNDNCLSRIPAEIARLEHLMRISTLKAASIKAVAFSLGAHGLTEEVCQSVKTLDGTSSVLYEKDLGREAPLRFDFDFGADESVGDSRMLSWELKEKLSSVGLVRAFPHLPPSPAWCTIVLKFHQEHSRMHAEETPYKRLWELLLNNNQLRVLPYEIGKLFNLQNIGLKGNPLTMEIQAVYSETNGTLKLLSYMLDNLAGSSS